jgi:predicted mannosyl-3-phosphoglycerate phosphatase (HAD superfamily)
MNPDLDTVMGIIDNDEKVRELFDKYYRVTKATAEELDGLSDDQTLALTVLAVGHLEKEYMSGLYVLSNATDTIFTAKVREAVKRFITGRESQNLRDFKEHLGVFDE